jgi:hypothetical protein
MNEGLSGGVDFCPITGTDCVAIADRSQAPMATRLSSFPRRRWFALRCERKEWPRTRRIVGLHSHKHGMPWLCGRRLRWRPWSCQFKDDVGERQLKFQRRVTLGAIAAALLMAVIGVFAGWQWQDAASERDRATAAEKRVAAERDRTASERDRATAAEKRVAAERDRADTKLAEAQTTQSRFLADLARQQRRTANDVGTALLLALEGLPDDTAGIARPYVPGENLLLAGLSRQRSMATRIRVNSSSLDHL